MHGVDTTLTGQFATVSLPVSQVLIYHTAERLILRRRSPLMEPLRKEIPIVSVDSLERREMELKTKGFKAILMFDYNSSELTPDVKELLKQLTERLPQGSTITILGSADVLGSQARNRAAL